MRFINALVFAVTVAVLFVFVGLPERQAAKAQHEVDPVPAVAPPIAEAACKCECNCESKLAELQKQVDDLRAKLAELQCKCDAPKAAPLPPAPQAAAPAPKSDACYVDANGRKVCPLLQQRAQAPVQPSTDGIVLNPGEVLVEVGGVPVGNVTKRAPVLFPNVGRKFR